MSNIFIVSLLTGLIVGSLSTAVQSFHVLPLIHQSEAFEGAPIISYESNSKVSEGKPHSHEPQTAVEQGDSEAEAWGPEDGFQRLFFTWASNALLSAGWAFLLCAAFLFIPQISFMTGLVWGTFGYLSFFVAPSLGLPPELPGMTAAELSDRQTWWVLTAIATMVGCCLIYFGRSTLYRFMALPFVLLPHIQGAPQPEFHGGSAPLVLWKEFVTATFVTNCISWLALGLIASLLFKKFSPKDLRV